MIDQSAKERVASNQLISRSKDSWKIRKLWQKNCTLRRTPEWFWFLLSFSLLTHTSECNWMALLGGKWSELLKECDCNFEFLNDLLPDVGNVYSNMDAKITSRSLSKVKIKFPILNFCCGEI